MNNNYRTQAQHPLRTMIWGWMSLVFRIMFGWDTGTWTGTGIVVTDRFYSDFCSITYTFFLF